MKAARIFLVIVAFGILCHCDVLGNQLNTLTINCTIHSPYEAFFFRLVEEICTRNHIPVRRNAPPVGRSLLNVNQGLDDGDGPRIGGLSVTYPEIVCVPEPFGDFVFGAFTRSQTISTHGWDSLADLNVAYVRGWKIFDQHVGEARSITKVATREILFELLDANRCDVALITNITGFETMKQLGLNDIRFAEPPLAVEPNFLYLNQRHRALISVFAKTLKAIKQDGTYARLYNEMIPIYPDR